MGLTTWAKAPDRKIIKTDVSVAKNYLRENELQAMGRLVNAYLDVAKDMAERYIPNDDGRLEKAYRQVLGCR